MTAHGRPSSPVTTASLIKPGQHLVIPGTDATAPIPAPAPAPASPAPAPAAPSLLPALPPAQPGGPWSIFAQPGGLHAAVAFGAALLRQLGAPVTPGNLKVIFDWEVSEGSGGQMNPLNGGDFGGLAISGQQYGGGANNYTDLATHIADGVP